MARELLSVPLAHYEQEAPMALSLRRGLVAAVVVMMLLPAPAGAQIVSFAELRNYVKAGDRVSLTDANDDKTTGKIEDLTTGALTLLVGDQKRTFSNTDVRKVVVKDSLRNGSLIGLAIGAVPGVWAGILFNTYCDNEGASCPAAPLIMGALFGGIGAGIGAGIDGLIHRSVHVQARGTARIGVAPVLGMDRQGMLLKIRF